MDENKYPALIDGLKVIDCVGCGYCCSKTPCGASLQIHNGVMPCPSLIWNKQEERHYCNLCAIPGDIGKHFRDELFVGAGCCCGMFNNWRPKLKDRTKYILSSNGMRDPVQTEMKYFLQALGREFIGSDTIYLILSSMKDEMLTNGYDIDTIKIYCESIIESIARNRSKSMDQFMG